MTETMTSLTPGSQKTLIEKVKKTPSLRMGKVELKFEPDNLDQIVARKARQELRETPEVIAEGLKGLRELLKTEPDLIVPMDYDEHLYKFLRPCKWYPDSAFGLMKRFYGFRRSNYKLCDGLVPSKEKTVFSSGVLTPLPIRSSDGCRILLIEGGRRWNPKIVSLEELFKAAMLSLEAAMAEPMTQVCGVKLILDMAGLSISHVTYFTPSFSMLVVEWAQRCMPARLKGVHIINQPFIFNMIFALFKPFLQEKLRNRIHFHGTNRIGLMEHIDKKVLPDRYGGDLELPNEPIGEPLWEYFCNFEEDFVESLKYGYVRKVVD